jgi:hypothetical protein
MSSFQELETFFRHAQSERLAAEADHRADYAEWLSETEGDSCEGREPTDWRQDVRDLTLPIFTPW